MSVKRCRARERILQNQAKNNSATGDSTELPQKYRKYKKATKQSDIPLACDKIYVINLDKSVDRWNAIDTALNNAKVDHQRFPAVNGLKMNITNLNTNETVTGQYMKDHQMRTSVGFKYLINCNPESAEPTVIKYSAQNSPLVPGELGLWCSNVMIWQDAQKHSYNKIIIFEDDIKLRQPSSFKAILNKFLTHLPATFDLGYIDLARVDGKAIKFDNRYVNKMSHDFNSYGTWAVVFSQKAINKLLSYEYYDLPIDCFYMNKRKIDIEGQIEEGLALEEYIAQQRILTVTGASEMERWD